MIVKTDVNENVYTLSNERGIIAYGNKHGISCLKYCLEDDEIKQYAKDNDIKTYGLDVASFFVIGYYVDTIK